MKTAHAIEIKYLCATNCKPSRIKATIDEHSLTVLADYADMDKLIKETCRDLIERRHLNYLKDRFDDAVLARTKNGWVFVIPSK